MNVTEQQMKAAGYEVHTGNHGPRGDLHSPFVCHAPEPAILYRLKNSLTCFGAHRGSWSGMNLMLLFVMFLQRGDDMLLKLICRLGGWKGLGPVYWAPCCYSSPYFKNEDSAPAMLKGVLDAISHEEYNYAVELRHKSWLAQNEREIEHDIKETLRERNVANVMIDGPGLHESTEQLADHAYVRFHGRNYDIWYKEEKENDHMLDRYDYLYRKDQLEPWVPQIKKVESETSKVVVYFNNHARSKSVRNAFLLMDMLSIEHKTKEIQSQDQFTLGEF